MPDSGYHFDRGSSEVFTWLKSVSPSLKLERLSHQFETRGFRSRRWLACVKSEHLDSLFSSPDKLPLAERRLLDAELDKVRKGTVSECKVLDREDRTCLQMLTKLLQIPRANHLSRVIMAD